MPVRAADLADLLQRLLGEAPEAPPPSAATTIHVVEDDAQARDLLMRVLERDVQDVIGCASAEAFLEAYHLSSDACLLVVAQLPGMSGFDLLVRLRQARGLIPNLTERDSRGGFPDTAVM